MLAILMVESEDWVLLHDLPWSTVEGLDYPSSLRRVTEAYVSLPKDRDKFPTWKAPLVPTLLSPARGLIIAQAHSDSDLDFEPLLEPIVIDGK